MVNLHEQEGFTPSELRSQLIDNLNRNGIREKLKSQLRSKLFAELSLATQIPSHKGPESNFLIVKVADSMFVEYLKNRGFDFTLSVFLPESGLDNSSHTLGERDLLRALHLDKQGSTARLLLKDQDETLPTSLLLRILESISTLNDRNTLEKEVQTKVEVDDLLHIKLRDMDRTIRSRAVQYDQSQVLLLEERMYSFQREMEEINEAKLKQQIENFKKIELAKLKLEEKSLFQAELQRQKIEFEQKLVAAQSKSVEQVTEERERIANREREMDRQNLLLKQQMLDEHNNVLIKEKQLRNESELAARQVALERDQLKKRVEEVLDQLEKLSTFKEKYTQKMEESMAQYKIDLNKEHATLLSTVQVEKAKLEGEKLLIDEKKATLDKMISSAGRLEREVERLRGELGDTTDRLGEAVRTRDTLLTQVNELQLQVLTQKGSSTLEFEISSLKRQLASAEQAATQRQQEHEAMIYSLSSNKVGSDSDIIAAKQNEMKWRQKCQELVAKLDSEYAAVDDLARKLEREQLRNKELERELADTRLLLHKSQTALKMASTETGSVDVSQYPGKSGITNEILSSSKNDPLFERYVKITSGLGKNQHSKIPLPSQFEDLSNSSISPLRQASISFREEFLTPQELALLKKGQIPLEYESPMITSTPPKAHEKSMLSDSSLSSPIRTTEQKIPSSIESETKLTPGGSDILSIKQSSEAIPKNTNMFTSPPNKTIDANLVTTIEKERDLNETTNLVQEQEKELEHLAAERKEAELTRKKVEEELQKQFEKEQALLAEERKRMEELEKEEKLKAVEAEKVKEAQERERMRLAEIERIREEERKEQEKLEKERLKKEEEMKSISALENDPLLQKYLSLVKEKKMDTQETSLNVPETRDGSHSDHQLSFGAGDTDSISAMGYSSSDNPSCQYPAARMTDSAQTSQQHNLNSATTTGSLETSGIATTETSHSGSDGVKEELCLSELYALLQSSVSTLDESPHKSLDTLTLLMEQICSQQEALQAASPPEVRLEFWRQVNATWLFVIDSILKSKALKKSDWKVVCETIIAVGNVLSLYGLIDYPLGFSELEILSAICERVDEFA